jgi:N-acetylmuramoyl-L-alanine amidase
MNIYYKILIVLLIVFVTLLSCINVSASLPLTGKLIVIDPGHGGLDPGTSVGKIYEKDINLAISKELKLELNKLGADVILTRDGDYDIASPDSYWRKRSDFDNRIALINDLKPDLYLSIHQNFLNDSSYYGPQVFYNKDNKKIALIIQTHLNKELKSNREIKNIPSNTYMYSRLKYKGVLIECGFLSNYKEKNLLLNKEYQKKLAYVIANSLIDYF